MIVSGEQGRDSAIHIHVSILSQTPLPSKLPHDTELSSLCFPVDPCWLSTVNIVACTCFFYSLSHDPQSHLYLSHGRGSILYLSAGGKKYAIYRSSVKENTGPAAVSLVIRGSAEPEKPPDDGRPSLDESSQLACLAGQGLLLSHCSDPRLDNIPGLPPTISLASSNRSENTSRELMSTRCCLYG